MKKLKKLICIGIAMFMCSCAGEVAKNSANGDNYYAGMRVGTDTYRRTVRNGTFRSDTWGENNSRSVDKVAGWGKFKIGAGLAGDLGSDLIEETGSIADQLID